MKKRSAILFLPLFALACGEGTNLNKGNPPPVNPGPVEDPSVAEARQTLKTVLDLHTTVIARSCGPTGGVCHNGKEYPDMRTPGSLINVLNKPCNKDRFDEPAAMFDGCELEADELVITTFTGEWRTRIGYLGPEEFDMERFTSFRHVTVEHTPEQAVDRLAARIVRNGETLVNLPANVLIPAGLNEGEITDVFNLEYSSIRALGYVRSGDPNGNGVYGASQPWDIIAPGHPDRSYLIGRITGEVPGTRMPLANHPLSDAEYVAIICWIETMSSEPAAHDAIDYDNCNFAKNPRSYQTYPRTN